MSEEQMIRHCSPTLAGMKTGNMVAAVYTDIDEMRASVRSWNKRLRNKGLRIIPLRFQENRALIYVYRPAKLFSDLQDEIALRILCQKGYRAGSPGQCIVQLMKQMERQNGFPHEVGLFLGYPPEDVCGFMENKAQRCKCVGCWKVYGDEEQAKKTFAKYRKCTRVYLTRYEEGSTIEKLTVAG